MANIIKIKRGSGVPGSGVLAGYELGYDTTNNSLYLGVEGANPIKVADSFQGYLSINNSTGKLTATQDFQVNGNVQLGDATTDTVTIAGLATVGGTLGVTGLATLSGGVSTVDIAASGNVDITGTLTVDGGSTLGDSADDVNTVRGVVTISDLNRLTTIQGSLEVDQAVGVDGNLRIGAAGTSKFTVAADSGAVSTSGTLSVTGNTTLGGTLSVTANTTLSGNASIVGTTTLTGNLTANGSVNTFNGALTVAAGNTLTANGNTQLTTVTATGLASLDGGVDVAGLATISSTTGDIATSGDLTANNAVINGNLTVHGTTTTVNSTTVEISDPIFTLGQTLGTSDAKDRGIEFNYGDTTTPLVGFFGLDESTGRFVFIPDAVNTSEVFSGAVGDFEVGDIYQGGTNVSQNWNAAAAALGISGGTGGITTGVQYDLLQHNGTNFAPTKTISADSGITIDCGTY